LLVIAERSVILPRSVGVLLLQLPLLLPVLLQLPQVLFCVLVEPRVGLAAVGAVTDLALL